MLSLVHFYFELLKILENYEKKEILTKSPLELIEGFYRDEIGEELSKKQRDTLVSIVKEVEADETN